MRPEWNLHFLVAVEALKVLSCDSEGAIFFWFRNDQIGRWFRSCIINKGLFHKLVLALGVHIEDLRFVLAISVFVVTGFSCYSIWTVCLTSWSVPDDIFHPIGMRPEWNLHFFITIETLKVLSCNGEGAIFFWFCNSQISCDSIGQFCRRIIDKGLFHKFVLTLGVYIEDLRFVFAISVFVVTSFGCYSIWTVCLTSWSVPDDIFHPIGMRPEWNLHFLVAIETLKIFSSNGEGAVFFWFCNSQIRWNRSLIFLSNGYCRRCSAHTRHLFIILNIVKMDIVKTGWVFMVRCFYIDGIGPIGLTVGCIPNKVILTTCFWPDWDRNGSNSIWRLNIWDDNVKASRHSIVIDNINLPT